MQSREITISCYLHEIPSFVERTWHGCMGICFLRFRFSEFSSRLKVSAPMLSDKAARQSRCCYSDTRMGEIDVFNEMIRIDEAEIHRFTRYMFAKFDRACVISFKAIQTNLQRLPFPFQQHNAKDDFVILLSRMPQDYTARLGKATRTNIKRYMKAPGSKLSFIQLPVL